MIKFWCVYIYKKEVNLNQVVNVKLNIKAITIDLEKYKEIKSNPEIEKQILLNLRTKSELLKIKRKTCEIITKAQKTLDWNKGFYSDESWNELIWQIDILEKLIKDENPDLAILKKSSQDVIYLSEKLATEIIENKSKKRVAKKARLNRSVPNNPGKTNILTFLCEKFNNIWFKEKNLKDFRLLIKNWFIKINWDLITTWSFIDSNTNLSDIKIDFNWFRQFKKIKEDEKIQAENERKEVERLRSIKREEERLLNLALIWLLAKEAEIIPEPNPGIKKVKPQHLKNLN